MVQWMLEKIPDFPQYHRTVTLRVTLLREPKRRYHRHILQFIMAVSLAKGWPCLHPIQRPTVLHTQPHSSLPSIKIRIISIFHLSTTHTQYPSLCRRQELCQIHQKPPSSPKSSTNSDLAHQFHQVYLGKSMDDNAFLRLRCLDSILTLFIQVNTDCFGTEYRTPMSRHISIFGTEFSASGPGIPWSAFLLTKLQDAPKKAGFSISPSLLTNGWSEMVTSILAVSRFQELSLPHQEAEGRTNKRQSWWSEQECLDWVVQDN